MGRISGPLLDRISIHVFVRPVEIDAFDKPRKPSNDGTTRDRIVEARARQKKRYAAVPLALNARLPERQIRRHCALDRAGSALLMRVQKRLRISARGRSQILRVARTIADLEGAERIADAHVSEAVQYRMRDLSSGVG